MIVSICSLARFHFARFFVPSEIICHEFYGPKDFFEEFNVESLSDLIEEVLKKMDDLQNKLESKLQKTEKDKYQFGKTNISRLEFRKYLDDQILQPLSDAHIALRQIRLPKVEKCRKHILYG